MNQAAQTNLTILPIGAWASIPASGESVRILDVETVWNHTVYHVWITRLATVERVPAESLSLAQREERAWAAELRKREQILPELQPVILLRVEAGNG